jgi:hypothetical protein
MFNMRVPALLQPWFDNDMKKQYFDSKELTQAELQRISAVLKTHIRVGTEVLQELKQESSNLWQQADRTDPSTKVWFEMFSNVNQQKRKCKKHLDNLESLQGKIKRILKS